MICVHWVDCFIFVIGIGHGSRFPIASGTQLQNQYEYANSHPQFYYAHHRIVTSIIQVVTIKVGVDVIGMVHHHHHHHDMWTIDGYGLPTYQSFFLSYL